MDGFEYIKNANQFYNPRTPFAALKAIDEGLLPKEAFIYKVGSVSPLYEEPFDLDEIDRVLAKKKMDIHTNLLLNKIFKKLIKDKDPEVALFAAESINIIENKYMVRIKDAKDILKKKEEPKPIRSLVRLYYELALLNLERETIKHFYLKEAYEYFKRLVPIKAVKKGDILYAIRILLLQKNVKEAEKLFTFMRKRAFDPQVVMLEAEASYIANDYSSLKKHLHQLVNHLDELDEKHRDLVRYWVGG